MKTLAKFLVTIFMLAFIGGAFAATAHVTPVVGFAAVLGIYLLGSIANTYLPSQLKNVSFNVPVDSLNVSTLASELGAYYREFAQQIHNELQIGMFQGKWNLNDRFTLMPDVIDEVALFNDVSSDFLHQHNPASSSTFNPTASALTPGANVLRVRKYEGDLQFLDNEIETSALTYIGNMKLMAKNLTPGQVQSFVEYLFWDTIIPKAQQNLRKALWQGTYNATASYGLLNILDGVQTCLGNAISAGSLTAVAMTSPTVNNIITLLESVFDTLGTAYQYADDLVCEMSPAMFKLLVRANRIQGGTGRSLAIIEGTTDQFSLTIDGYPNVKIFQEPFLTGNQILIARKFNKVIGLSMADNVGSWEFQRLDRTTKFMLNGKIGFNFRAINLDSTNLNVALGQ